MKNRPQPSVLFCDVGGILVENPWIYAARKMSESYGLGETRIFDELTKIARALDRGEITLREFHRDLNASLKIRSRYADFEGLALGPSLRRIVPVWDSVRALKESAEFKVVALSNMSKEVWAVLRARFGIQSLFDSAVLSFELGVAKPDPRIYRLALTRAGAKAERCLFVDDIPENVRAARSLGLGTYLAREPPATASFLLSLIGSKGRNF